jgi:hypothetical protein
MHLGLGLSVTLRRGGSSLDASTSALVARMSSAPNATRQGQINTLITSIKTAGVWDKLDGLYLLAAADAQSARLNWKGATFTLAETGTVTFTTDRGYNGDGTTGHLLTSFTPSVSGGLFTLNSAHLGAYILDNIDNAVACMGQVSGSASSANIFPRNANRIQGSINDATTAPLISVSTSIGHTVVNRSGATARQYYRDGSLVGSDATAATALPTAQIALLRSFSAFDTRKIAAAHLGASLTAGETAALTSALQSYLQSVGAV